MPEAGPAYSVVLPAYHEEENLRALLPRLQAALSGAGPFEIVVVDTSTPRDNTASLCGGVVRCVNRSPSDSYGDAVRTGIASARGEWILFMDADGSHAPELIPTLIAESRRNDVVVASRYIAGGGTENAKHLVFMSRLLNLTYARVLNLRCTDVSTSFKLYRGDLLRALHLTCNNFDIIEEMLFKLGKVHPGLRLKEVPFTFQRRRSGKTKRNLLRFIVTYLVTMVRLRFSHGRL